MKIGDKIRDRRKKAKLTQEDIARLLDVDRVTVSKYESGAIDIPLSRLEKMAEALEVSIVELLDVDDNFPVTLRYEAKKPTGDGEQKRSSPDELQLTEGETALIQLFRKVPQDKQRIVIEMIRAALSTE